MKVVTKHKYFSINNAFIRPSSSNEDNWFYENNQSTKMISCILYVFLQEIILSNLLSHKKTASVEHLDGCCHQFTFNNKNKLEDRRTLKKDYLKKLLKSKSERSIYKIEDIQQFLKSCFNLIYKIT